MSSPVQDKDLQSLGPRYVCKDESVGGTLVLVKFTRLQIDDEDDETHLLLAEVLILAKPGRDWDDPLKELDPPLLNPQFQTSE